jgi:hypothetical protein
MLMAFQHDFIREVAHFKSCKLLRRFTAFFSNFGLKHSIWQVDLENSITGSNIAEWGYHPLAPA